MTCSPFRAHTEPLCFANKVLNSYDINDYIIGTFMYECLYGNIHDIFRNYFQINADVHDHNLNVNDLYVPNGWLDIRKIQYKDPICGILFLRLSKTQKQFVSLRKNMRHYLTERKGYA